MPSVLSGARPCASSSARVALGVAVVLLATGFSKKFVGVDVLHYDGTHDTAAGVLFAQTSPPTEGVVHVCPVFRSQERSEGQAGASTHEVGRFHKHFERLPLSRGGLASFR